MPTPRRIPALARAASHGARVAIADPAGDCTYRDLVAAAERMAAVLLGGGGDLREARIAFTVARNRTYTQVQWGIWLAGGIAVPLCASHPRPELEHAIEDSGAEILIADPAHHEQLAAIAGDRRLRLCSTTDRPPALVALPEVAESRRAMILYTSGTTGRPKGVVTTHAQLGAQIECLVEAWEWTADDRILLVLPLHHVHGIVNVLGCALWSGAVCEMAPRFDARATWQRFATGGLSLFMAVPTIYQKLIDAFDDADVDERAAWSAGVRALRLMVSGSAALPASVLERWREITGHTLLERYGMTEIGMALGNPLRGERRPGTVGAPLPGVEVRLVDERGAPAAAGQNGEIQVRGPGVFLEYWRRPDATAAAFDGDWFRTGDTALVEDGRYRILGRTSVDILKTGGYKVSALEIEEALREHPAIAEVAVVGVPDSEWGDRVAAAVVPRAGHDLDVAALRAWAKQRLAPYKVPSRWLLLEELPRNALGKVTKPALLALLSPR